VTLRDPQQKGIRQKGQHLQNKTSLTVFCSFYLLYYNILEVLLTEGSTCKRRGPRRGWMAQFLFLKK
jgi:hypothetical protein